MDLLIGTSNQGKLREFGEMLVSLPFRILSLKDVGLAGMDVEEPFDTFVGNAEHKAKAFAKASGLMALADDSGIAVDALDGRPGVYSARYAPGNDRDRYLKLLGELEGVPVERRGARFVAVVAAAKPDGETVSAEGVIEGKVAFAPGEELNGFGYDAVFIPNGFEVVFSALPPAEKNRLSHRGIGLKNLMPALERLANS